jgi:hypothetical protein
MATPVCCTHRAWTRVVGLDDAVVLRSLEVLSEETPRSPDHSLTAIARGCAAGVAGFGIAAAFVVTGVASAGGVAWIPALSFALVYLSWRPTGLALRLAGEDAPRDARTLVTAVPSMRSSWRWARTRLSGSWYWP